KQYIEEAQAQLQENGFVKVQPLPELVPSPSSEPTKPTRSATKPPVATALVQPPSVSAQPSSISGPPLSAMPEPSSVSAYPLPDKRGLSAASEQSVGPASTPKATAQIPRPDPCLFDKSCKDFYEMARRQSEAGQLEAALINYQNAYAVKQAPWLLISI